MPTDQELIAAFFSVQRLHRRVIESKVRGLGIHHSQHRMLVHLFCRETPPSQKELAEHFHISPAAVAETMKRLEEDGYIQRSCDDKDSRRNLVSVTDKGREMLDCTRHLFDGVDAAMLADLSESERAALAHCLAVMQKNLQNSLTEPEVPAATPGKEPQ